jgi:predicted phosphodiesterase
VEVLDWAFEEDVAVDEVAWDRTTEVAVKGAEDREVVEREAEGVEASIDTQKRKILSTHAHTHKQALRLCLLLPKYISQSNDGLEPRIAKAGMFPIIAACSDIYDIN